MKHTKLLTIIALLLCVATLFVACGGNGDKGNEPTAATTEAGGNGNGNGGGNNAGTPEENKAALIAGVNATLTNLTSGENSTEDLIPTEKLAEVYDLVKAVKLSGSANVTMDNVTINDYINAKVQDGVIYLDVQEEGTMLFFIEEDLKIVPLYMNEEGVYEGDKYSVTDLLANFTPDMEDGGAAGALLTTKVTLPEFTAADLSDLGNNEFQINNEYFKKAAYAYLEQFMNAIGKENGATDAEIQEQITVSKTMIDEVLSKVTIELKIGMANKQIASVDLLVEVKTAYSGEAMDYEPFKLEVSLGFENGVANAFSFKLAQPSLDGSKTIEQGASLKILSKNGEICGAEVTLDMVNEDTYITGVNVQEGDNYKYYDLRGDETLHLEATLDFSKQAVGETFADITYTLKQDNMKAYTWDETIYEDVYDQAVTDQYAFVADNSLTVKGVVTEAGATVNIEILSKEDGEITTDGKLEVLLSETVTDFPEITDAIIAEKDQTIEEYLAYINGEVVA